MFSSQFLRLEQIVTALQNKSVTDFKLEKYLSFYFEKFKKSKNQPKCTLNQEKHRYVKKPNL